MHSTRTRLTPRFNGWIFPAAPGSGSGKAASYSSWLRPALLGCLGIATTFGALFAGTGGLQNAIANGDTRTLSFYHAHTRESLTVTFRRNGRYDRAELQKLNWFLRDWRNDESISMDPKLFDIVWAAQREAGSRGTIKVLSAYRSPKTNAMLRRRSSAVAKNSQHTQGRALDFALPDADMARVRAIGMRLQRGGVGYYPNVPFVHLDSGSVRSWPRMPRNQLERLFPDGRTVHLPADGKPLQGYEAARQTIIARGDLVPGMSAAAVAEAASQPQRRRSFWATLFGGADEAEDADVADTASRRQVASRPSSQQQAAPDTEADSDPRSFFLAESRRNANNAPRQVARAPEPEPAPAPAAAPQPAPIGRGGRPVTLLPATPAVQPPVPEEVFEGPLPVARPTPVFVPGPAPATEPPAIPDTAPALVATLPPARPGIPALAAVPGESTVVATLGPAIPAPPTRPQELAVASARDRNALAALASASETWGEGQADTTIQTAALAYAPEPVSIAPPLPPSRPQMVAAVAQAQSAEQKAPTATPVRPPASVRLSPSLPPATVNDERRALTQLFATVATETKPLPRATVRTAKVVTAEPSVRARGPVTAAPPVVVQMEFTNNANATGLSTDSFSGAAVAPLPVSRLSE
ncbi:DUF882 domain-containing protein [Pseudochelatococcus contaminans]|uniref:Murein endopeptidase K n=1 Tax=Pseudochelatococcus contaminans TaxID=1538103 RepID=A0A7W6EIP8_9HYPH|nr:DUF882 domain-containing protein [Pseudochelatococcus contaminans]MBB3811012.1 uncharacterized protein YcbK (DUF882 family) [Pseudochelatococcus contaminans]